MNWRKVCASAIVMLLCGVLMSTVIAMAQGEYVDTSKYKKQPPYVVGLSNVSPANAFKVAMVEEFKAEAEKLKKAGVIKQYYITDAGGAIAKQIADIEDLMAKGVDLLLVTATSPSAISPVVEKAVSRGIVVVSFDNVVDTPKVTVRLGANQEELGGSMMRWLCEELGGKGKIVMLGGIPGTSSAVRRWKGAEDVLKKYPGIEVVGTAWVNWAFDKGKAAMENFLAAHPVINGVWTDGGGSAQGALTACMEAGRIIPVTGTASNGFLKLWAQLKPKGFRSYSATEPPYCSVVALELGLKVLQGEKVKHEEEMPLEIVTNGNVESLARFDVSDIFWVHTKLSDDKVRELWGTKK
ncbi:MAG: ABC transporter substrate-binding protein [Firmicutes bacterium]|nr:ABC transporter substrate-binding protein [Bacillota bacterium]